MPRHIALCEPPCQLCLEDEAWWDVRADSAAIERMGRGMTIHGRVDKVVVMEDNKEA